MGGPFPISVMNTNPHYHLEGGLFHCYSWDMHYIRPVFLISIIALLTLVACGDMAKSVPTPISLNLELASAPTPTLIPLIPSPTHFAKPEAKFETATPTPTLIPVIPSPTHSAKPETKFETATPTSWPVSSPTRFPTVTPSPYQKRSKSSEYDLQDSVVCSVSNNSLKVLCTAPEELFGEWSSNATTRSLGGSTFEFEIEIQVPEIIVEWDVCIASACSIVTVYIEPPEVPLESIKLAGIEVQNQVVEEAQEVFWNERPSDLPECDTDFRFSHRLVNPDDVGQLMFGPGGHIEPHEHMIYWGLWSPGGREAEEDLANPNSQATPIPEGTLGDKRQVSEKIQLYAPTDIYRVDVGYANRSTEKGETFIEWGGYIYACNGHQLMLGHIGEPSDEMLAILAQSEPTCDLIMGYASKGETGCSWVIDTFISAGTPIFKSSGYAGAFDFGLSLFGLTADELRKQPGYGYSITPWRVSSGRAVCPLEYFPEPLRSDYLKLLSDNMTDELLECGPFNQDVPNTAMGFWLPSASPEIVPLLQSDRDVDEWDTVWLFEDGIEASVHVISVGNNTFGLDYGQHRISTVSEGLVNRRWDSIQPGKTYCSELGEIWADSIELYTDKTLVIRLSDDGSALTLEVVTDGRCGDPPWIFKGNERTFYR